MSEERESYTVGGEGDWLQAAQARCDAATLGPWWYQEDTYVGDEGWWVLGPKDGGVDEHHTLVALPYNPHAQADATFAAHARTDLPRALARITELEKQLGDGFRYEGPSPKLKEYVQNLEAENGELRQQLGEAREALRPLAQAGMTDYYFGGDIAYPMSDSITQGDIDRAAAILRDAATALQPQQVEGRLKPLGPSDGICVCEDYTCSCNLPEQEEGEYPARDGVRDTSVREGEEIWS